MAFTGNPEIGGETTGIDAAERETLHRAIHQIDEIWHLLQRVAPLLPVLEAYERGGKIAASTALRRMGRS